MATTTITGKMFQMQSASGENRFPKTVMEAVYGLNTYLQTEFQHLSDIYLPIEGISEAKTGQEFVFRKNPSTIKPNVMTLDRIYGKTLAWNQISDTHNNGSAGNTSWTFSGSGSQNLTITVSNGVANTAANIVLCSTGKLIVGHKYYLGCDMDFTPSTTTIRIGNPSYYWWTYDKFIYTPNATQGYFAARVEVNSTAAGTYHLTNIMMVDLTLLYGSEISGLTDNQIMEKFRSDFPAYAPYNSGTLISNDASAVETVGFNLWDEEWEAGQISSSGENSSSSNRIRSKNYIPVISGQTYCITAPTGARALFAYDANKLYTGISITITNNLFVIPSGVSYIRFHVGSSAYSLQTYNHDICINLSDTNKNGTYEPYRKSTLNLGLDNLKVKSPNIWDEQWIVGTIVDATGAINTGSGITRLVSKNFLSVIGGKQYYVKKNSSDTLYLYFYDGSGTYLGSNEIQTITTTLTFTVPANAAKMLFATNTSHNYYNNDICINVSQAGINGKYFSHNDITITGGLKSAGSVKDEIVGNRYIKRVGRVNMGDLTWNLVDSSSGSFRANTTIFPATSVLGEKLVCSKYKGTSSTTWAGMADKEIGANDGGVVIIDSTYISTTAANFKTAMSSVYTDYELATPEEYELVTPISPSVTAGTTESRVSPNAYGLSAPFCGDMTYSVGQANDAANSQYATLAGKLYNTHKIWGQDFDGTQDVSGAMTGVTSLNSLLYFSNGKVGIGTNNPSEKLHVYNGNIQLSNGYKLKFSDGTDYIWYDVAGGEIVFDFSHLSYFESGIQSASFITAGAYASSSDAKLKDNIQTISSDRALSVLSALSGKEWTWNDKNEYLKGKHGSGLVAQEVEKVMPWAVLDNNGELSLNYNSLWGFAIPVLQSHEERIKALEEKCSQR